MQLNANTKSYLPYAGDITSVEAWNLLKTKASAVLVDVRTQPEWEQGVADLSSLNKTPHFISIKLAPDYSRNPDFIDNLVDSLGGITRESVIIFMCRGGGRSSTAASEITAAFGATCYNIAGGFEGEVSTNHGIAGWKASNLLWEIPNKT